MYANSAAAPRKDISTFLEEAVGVEKNFIGQTVLPIYSSDIEIGRYPKLKIGNGDLLRPNATRRGSTGTYNEVDRKWDWDTFQTEEFGLEERIDDVIAKRMENFFDVEVTVGKLVMRELMLDYEMAVAGVVMNANSYLSTNVITPTQDYTEANLATIDFPRDVQAVQEQMTYLGEAPNTAIMSLTVFNRIRRSKLMQLYLFGSLSSNGGARQIDEAMVANALGVDRIIVTKASYNMQGKGRTIQVGPIWGNSYIALVNIQSGDFHHGGLGRTIIWDADSPNGLFATETYRAEHRRGNMVRVRTNRTLKIINPNAGGLIQTNFA